ncbi:MAG: peptidase T [Lonepinella koalarum]|nr:peptidase T [Lonepinella koalarum]
MLDVREPLLTRFLSYVKLETQSKRGAKISPSSAGQWVLAKQLVAELQDLGLTQIELSDHCVVTAFLPANVPDAPTIGLISHLDTSPEQSGKNVNPEIIENYRGGDIALGNGEDFISPVFSPFLHALIGKTLIVTDGKTLLGADNKAGIAEIMTALWVLKNSQSPHCNLRIAFTPDEEIGLGMSFFPMEKFACDWAYTIDGGEVGELEYENFNAASARVIFYGHNTHTGTAKNVLINALSLACEFQQGFPTDETPETTADREGFYHLNQFSGTVEKAELHYLIRDFDRSHFATRKAFIEKLVTDFNQKKKLPKLVELEIEDSYLNMFEQVQKVPQSIELADKAMRACGISPKHKAIRGGTDGAWLAEKGLACPNIFTGGYNFHSKSELITLEGMESAVKVIVEMMRLATQK